MNDSDKMLARQMGTRKFGAAGGGYDATLPRGKRRVPLARSRSEDAELNNSERFILQGTTRDLRRNFSVAAWAIRKHLDYVSTFAFQCRCSNSSYLLAHYKKEDLQKLDDQIELIMRTWSRAPNFDSAGRHSLTRMLRISEALRTVDGDVLAIQRRNGTVQLVEGDRIRNPIGAPAAELGLPPDQIRNILNGVLVDPSTGRALSYAVHRRDRTGMVMRFDRMVPAAFAALHGYFDRYDQVRGISPLAAAVNQYRDLYESFDYTLAKEKVAQLFAMVVTRQSAEAMGAFEAETDSDSAGDEPTGYNVDFGRGPIFLDMDPGDKAEFLSSANPSSESQAFWNFILMIALKALDIPLSFFDESHTNYSGQRVAWLMYDQSAATKRDDNRELLNRWTAWRLGLAILDDELVLPEGMRITDLAWEWISRGIPWVDPLKEVSANVAAIGAGLADPQEIIKSQGKDPFEVVDRIAEFQAYAREKGVSLSFIPPNVPPEDPAANDAGGNSGKPNRAKKN